MINRDTPSFFIYICIVLRSHHIITFGMIIIGIYSLYWWVFVEIDIFLSLQISY